MIIVADENIPLLHEFFADFGELRALPGRHLCAGDITEANALLVRSVTPVNDSLLANSSTEFIASATIGTDHVDQRYLQKKGISFANAPGCNAESVADYVTSALLNLAAEKQQSLQDKVIGVVGVGNVGSAVVTRLQALGSRVICCDPPKQASGLMEDGVELAELMAAADVICLHAPLIHEGDYPTYHLINESTLSQLKPGAWLLNAGRGAVIDNQALKQQLQQSDNDLTVILDVWESEPNIDIGLLAQVQWGTPHIAGYSIEGRMRGTEMVYQAFCRHFGFPIEKSLAQFLPKARPLDITVSANSSLSSLLLQAVNHCYCVAEDDGQLREQASLAEETVGVAFDQLRRYYPERRQFLSTPVYLRSSAISVPPVELLMELSRQLKVLGFLVSLVE